MMVRPRAASCTCSSARDQERASPHPTRRRQLAGGALLMPLWVSSKPGLAAEKLKNLPIEKVKDIAARSFVKNQYFVSGRLPKEVYADDAYFKDPTQTTQGADKWSRLVPLLFDAPKSKVQLISTNVKDSHHFEFRFRLDGRFTPLLLGLKLKAFTATCLFTTNEEGLIVEQKEFWDVPASDLAISSVFPSYGKAAAAPVEKPIDF